MSGSPVQINFEARTRNLKLYANSSMWGPPLGPPGRSFGNFCLSGGPGGKWLLKNAGAAQF